MKRWTPPSKERQTVESKQFFSPTPDDLRTLIFDYLCHSAFTDTARAFMRDSAVKHVDADGDEMMSAEGLGHTDPLAETMEERLAQAELRREIRINILSGRVDDAIALLNTHFPAVLSPDPTAHGVVPASDTDSTIKYVPPASVDPAHLHLNLRILGFIESARTVPLSYRHPGSKVSLSPPPLSPFTVSDDKKRTSDDPEFSEQQLILLHKAQKLYSEAGSLPKADDRALYLNELSQVTALLAYTDPENSIMAPYLEQNRREAVADQIEGAILCRTSQQAVPHIELAVRYTTTVWSVLNEKEISLPLRNKWPAGVKLPVPFMSPPKPETSAKEGDASGTAKKSQERPSAEPAPPFDLTEFLDAKYRS